jgi:acetyl/propionyl-CoA carboxylase alpha subunit
VFDTVLVAGRGVLSGRIVRTCQRLGARAVTVHSAADVTAPHVAGADESMLLGGDDPATTYLDGRKVIEAAGQAAAQALHPGGGPLAGSAAFAQSVVDAGLVWLGPPPAVLEALAARPAAVPVGGRRLVVQLLGLEDGRVLAVTDLERRTGVVECPAPEVSAPARQALRVAAVRAGETIGLVGPGTVELVVDGDHLVVAAATAGVHVEQSAVELVTGVDLVEQHLLLAGGTPTTYDGAAAAEGVALQAELRAAAPGALTAWLPPGRRDHVRVETGYAEGQDTSPHDDLLGALAVWGPDRDAAATRLQATRTAWVVDGVPLRRQA